MRIAGILAVCIGIFAWSSVGHAKDLSALSADELIATIPFRSVGSIPDASETVDGMTLLYKEVARRGPLGMLASNNASARLVLVETFADGSEIRRVYRTIDEARKAFAQLEKSDDGTQKNGGGYTYYATITTTNVYGSYTTIYGSNDGQNWDVIRIIMEPRLR
jgi:hypothetical protein